MALSLARSLSTKLSISRVLWKTCGNACVVQVANKQTLTEELGLPPLPKRPSSAYLQWFNSNKDRFRKAHPDLTFKEQTKKLGETWTNLSLSEKEHWTQLYRKERDVYDKKYEEYMKRLTPQEIASLKNLKKKKADEKMKRHIRRERKKDNLELGKPKHPGNAFTIYLLTLDRKELPVKEFLQTAANMWRQLPEKEVQMYRDKALRNREVYKKELHEWEMRMIREGRSDLVRQHHQLEDLKRTPQRSIRLPSE
ncbi:hypothetical protein SK128_014769 [Halocaridina rubra]|uniref:HMG box domain-containing protein n=1 Tax=Halocaridina rubra TaxID=373956 RepID=A0AAN8XUP7_HALRR